MCRTSISIFLDDVAIRGQLNANISLDRVQDTLFRPRLSACGQRGRRRQLPKRVSGSTRGQDSCDVSFGQRRTPRTSRSIAAVSRGPLAAACRSRSVPRPDGALALPPARVLPHAVDGVSRSRSHGAHARRLRLGSSRGWPRETLPYSARSLKRSVRYCDDGFGEGRRELSGDAPAAPVRYSRSSPSRRHLLRQPRDRHARPVSSSVLPAFLIAHFHKAARLHVRQSPLR